MSLNYWFIYQDILKNSTTGGNNGLYFITANERIAPQYLANYTVIGFYTAIVLLIFSIVKLIVRINTTGIFINGMQQPDVLLLLCEGVIIARMEGDTAREKELYQKLIDIMRSPSTIKIMTPNTFKEKLD